MRPPPAVASDQEGVFRHTDALAAGWTGSALRHGVRTGDLLRLRTGVYAVPPRPGPTEPVARATQLAIAAALTHHITLVSHLGAARLCRWDVWAPTVRACVTRPPSTSGTVTRVHEHRSVLAAADRARRGLVAMTSPARTAVDVAREFGAEAGLVVADAGLRSGLLTPADLAAAVGRASGTRRVADARVALGLATGFAESPLESRSLWAITRAGLPVPEQQVDLWNEYGEFIGRADFYWKEFGVVGEADGKSKLRTEKERWRVVRRDAAMRRTGLGYESWGWSDLTPFAPTAAKLRSAFGRGQTDGPARRWRARPSRMLVPASP